MHVVERGSGVPLILLHGFSVDHRLLLPLDATIAAAGDWRRIYIDLPGHGRTPAGDVASTEDVVGAVESEIIGRIGESSFAILGASFGGMLARRIAHDFRHRVLGLATVAGVFVADRSDRTLPQRTVLSEDAAVLRELGDAAPDYAEMAVTMSAANAQAFVTSVYPGVAAADRAALQQIAENYALAAEPEDAVAEPFDQPTLFITARQDHIAGYADAWARIEHYPRASFAVLDSAGHNVHLDRSTLAGALITDWLNRVGGR